MFSPASYIWLFKIVYSFHSWKHFKQYSIIFFPYFHIHVDIQRGKICIWIDCKKVSLTLSSITLPPCRNGIFQTELHSMCASVWNLWGDFRKITHLFWGMILENEYVVLLRKKKKKWLMLKICIIYMMLSRSLHSSGRSAFGLSSSVHIKLAN